MVNVSVEDDDDDDIDISFTNRIEIDTISYVCVQEEGSVTIRS
jgi:hypothetical protein